MRASAVSASNGFETSGRVTELRKFAVTIDPAVAGLIIHFGPRLAGGSELGRDRAGTVQMREEWAENRLDQDRIKENK